MERCTIVEKLPPSTLEGTKKMKQVKRVGKKITKGVKAIKERVIGPSYLYRFLHFC